jgi:hypothetical protein
MITANSSYQERWVDLENVPAEVKARKKWRQCHHDSAEEKEIVVFMHRSDKGRACLESQPTMSASGYDLRFGRQTTRSQSVCVARLHLMIS